ncbi:hypothetical protein ABZ829_00575 [Streptomyces xanthochromogenes]|uniref:hypothetical protein n=1 Tax=Streptomyces xanthochromogenes TaxID=67384 RepID=UPI00343415BC
MNIPWGDITTSVAACAGVIAAFGAWRAADRSAKTAELVASIERERWHAELTPQFTIELMETGNGQAVINVHLDGPDSLRHLDCVAIAVGNDDRGRTLLHPERGLTQADIDAHVWGPFKFAPGANGIDEHGRGPEPFPLAVGSGQPRAMQRTRPGHWMDGKTQGVWQGEYAGKPVRLVLTCRRGDEEWVIHRQLENPPFQPAV